WRLLRDASRARSGPQRWSEHDPPGRSACTHTPPAAAAGGTRGKGRRDFSERQGELMSPEYVAGTPRVPSTVIPAIGNGGTLSVPATILRFFSISLLLAATGCGNDKPAPQNDKKSTGTQASTQRETESPC